MQIIVSESWDFTLLAALYSRTISFSEAVAVRNGTICLGMSPPLIKLMWDEPDKSEHEQLVRKTKTILTWYYMDGARRRIHARVTFDDDRVVKWETSEAPDDSSAAHISGGVCHDGLALRGWFNRTMADSWYMSPAEEAMKMPSETHALLFELEQLKQQKTDADT